MAIRQHDDNKLRMMITQECARIMADDGVTDFLLAKRKAAARLGVSNKRLLPANVEIEQALLEYQRLFKASAQAAHLRARRETAIEAMRLFARFRPRLVGSVLAGTAGPHSKVDLHLFADTSEEVVLFLMEHAIPFKPAERRLRFSNGETASFPVLSFTADEISIDLIVFPPQAERCAPLSPVDGRPMRRAGLAAVCDLLDEPKKIL